MDADAVTVVELPRTPEVDLRSSTAAHVRYKAVELVTMGACV